MDGFWVFNSLSAPVHVLGVIVGVVLLSIFAGVVIIIIRKRRKRYTVYEEILSMDVKPNTFTYSELKNASQDFNPSDKLGEGGFGSVYKRIRLYILIGQPVINGYQCSGYLAPEYAMRGHLTEKTDVYAFGVVALELVSGRKNSDENLEEEKQYLLEWVHAWNLHEKSRDFELVDDELKEYKMEEVKRMIGIALLCTQSSHALRPPMSRVVAMLTGDVEVNDATSKPGYLTDCTFDGTTSSSFSNFQTNNTSLSTIFVTPAPETATLSQCLDTSYHNLLKKQISHITQ
ncbi:PREDICTED: probable LRR receptor-like serine/threonine-protein kinase At1g56140 [Camelina sativa]|uniref:Probable LRR receptor-like serine/threonine-protein kinase At1g56140 n=1 Tax=Camelina sativa TaxID=90675 RepID=A0ABM0YJN7_CAMSA|nr:PREDICTED: probable LRR receptor-like serine/threonine-protein kinase At1g56140 [Camelina sativa]